MRTTRFYRARRAVWRVRRSVPRLARPISAVLPSPAPPERPILVVGCPRSGTSLLLRGLLGSGQLRSVQAEGHVLWDEFHHPRDRGWDSDALDRADVTPREREYIYTAVRVLVRGRRFVDKTPANCLRVGYLAELFPEARFVFLRRRAVDNVNSLLEGWRARPRFVRYRLPEPLVGLGPLSGNEWSFVLVPGWRDLRRARLEVVCAAQYVACNEAVLAARDALSADRFTDVAYEELVADPSAVLASLCVRLEVAFGEEARRLATALTSTPSSTALTAPRPGKWRDENRDAIERILPTVRDTELRLGYEPS